jgi:hypothetical protein
MMAAQWMGVEPWTLAEQDEFWTEAGLVMRGIEMKARERAHKEG